MKKYLMLLMAVASTGLLGCMPNLVVRGKPVVDSGTNKFVEVVIANIGRRSAGTQLTYLELNDPNAPESAKPQCQYSLNVPAIEACEVWTLSDAIPDGIPFDKFSCRPGIDLKNMEHFNVVVRVDAKDMVKEKNENDNVYDENH